MAYVIQLTGLAGSVTMPIDPEARHLTMGGFVKKYDPWDNDGRGSLVATADPDDAAIFADAHEAVHFAQQEAGTRDDGEPNRPLTAFNLSVLSLEQARIEARGRR